MIYKSPLFQKHKQDQSPNTSCSSTDGSDNLRIKLDGSFNNTTTYSIGRSPSSGAGCYQQPQQQRPDHGHEEEEDEDESSSEDEEEKTV